MGTVQSLTRSQVVWRLAIAYVAIRLYQERARRPTIANPKSLNIRWLPFFGHMLGVVDSLSDPIGYDEQLCRRTNWQPVNLCFPSYSVFYVYDAKDLEHILKNVDVYCKNHEGFEQSFETVFQEILGRGIFATDGEEWLKVRKVASFMFTKNGLREQMNYVFVEHAEHLAKHLEDMAMRKGATERVLDLQDLFTAATFDTISAIAFGYVPNALASQMKGTKLPFLKAFDKIQQICGWRLVQPAWLWRLQRKLNIGLEKNTAKYRKQLVDEVDRVVAQRKREILKALEEDNLPKRQDLLTLFIVHAKRNNNEEMLTAEFLRDLTLNFMVAGRDTTAFTLTNVFKLLGQHEHYRKRCIEEIKQVLGNDGQVTLDKLSECTFLDAVFNETLRLYPPVGEDLKIVARNDVLPSGIQVPENSVIVVNNRMIGRNPDLFPHEPEKFLPERWYTSDNPPAVSMISEYKFPVFWGGHRKCLGFDMARFESKVFMAILLPRVEIIPQPHEEKFLLSPVNFYEKGLPVKLKNLNHQVQ